MKASRLFYKYIFLGRQGEGGAEGSWGWGEEGGGAEGGREEEEGGEGEAQRGAGEGGEEEGRELLKHISFKYLEINCPPPDRLSPSLRARRFRPTREDQVQVARGSGISYTSFI